MIHTKEFALLKMRKKGNSIRNSRSRKENGGTYLNGSRKRWRSFFENDGSQVIAYTALAAHLLLVTRHKRKKRYHVKHCVCDTTLVTTKPTTTITEQDRQLLISNSFHEV